jgi:hypothetical protein
MVPMRHSGRTFRPPGPDFPVGLFPDMWGFGSSRELPPVAPSLHRARSGPPRVAFVRSSALGPASGEPARSPGRLHVAPDPAREAAPPDGLAGLIARIGKLFA